MKKAGQNHVLFSDGINYSKAAILCDCSQEFSVRRKYEVCDHESVQSNKAGVIVLTYNTSTRYSPVADWIFGGLLFFWFDTNMNMDGAADSDWMPWRHGYKD